MAKASTVAQSLVEQGADVTLGEWPFRLAVGGDRLRDLSLPHLSRPSLELIETRDAHEESALATVCRLMVGVGEELSWACSPLSVTPTR